jgi:hypothetical protein
MPGPETRMILRVFFLSQASLCTAQELSLSIAAKNSVTDIYIGVLAAPQSAPCGPSCHCCNPSHSRVFKSKIQMFGTQNFM